MKIFYKYLIPIALIMLRNPASYSVEESAVNPVVDSVSEQKILDSIAQIAKGDMDVFLDKSSEINNVFMDYVKFKTENCSSAIEPVELNDEGVKIVKIKKVSTKEKNLCLSHLLRFKLKFTQSSFDGRKKYLRYTQELQWKELIEFEKNHLQQLKLLEKNYQ